MTLSLGISILHHWLKLDLYSHARAERQERQADRVIRSVNAAAAMQFILSQRWAADYTNFNVENNTMLVLFTLCDADYSW